MKFYDIDIETSYGSGIYDGDKYSDLRVRERKAGEWVKAKDALKLQERIDRMQKRIDKLEGRASFHV